MLVAVVVTVAAMIVRGEMQQEFHFFLQGVSRFARDCVRAYAPSSIHMKSSQRGRGHAILTIGGRQTFCVSPLSFSPCCFQVVFDLLVVRFRCPSDHAKTVFSNCSQLLLFVSADYPRRRARADSGCIYSSSVLFASFPFLFNLSPSAACAVREDMHADCSSCAVLSRPLPCTARRCCISAFVYLPGASSES